MDRWKQRRWTAFGLILLAVALAAVTVWLFVAHPSPGDGPGRPPGPFMEDIPGPPPIPLSPEIRMLLVGVLVLLITLCILVAVRLFKRPFPSPMVMQAMLASVSQEETDTIRFKLDYKTVTVALSDIRYIESMSEYVKIYLDSQPNPLVVLYSLKRLTTELPVGRFMRIHRSFIVALDRIREAPASSVVLDGPVTLPVGESYRPAFREYLSKRPVR